MKQPAHQQPVPLGTAHLYVFRALAWLLSKAGNAYLWLMYCKDLTVPMATYQAKIPIDIGLASDADMDELAALYHQREPAKAPGRARIYRDRLRGGSLCFVARIDGVIVGSNWIRVHTAVGADQLRMHFGEDEIYTTDAYTDDAWRGQGIHPALNQAQLDYARRQGYRIAYTLVRADNERSWITMGRVGWQHCGTMLIFRPSWSERRTFWQVWGDPYPMPLARGFSVSTAPAAAELPRSQSPSDRHPQSPPSAVTTDPASFDLSQFSERELVAEWPWARTYRLRKGDELAWLKIVPIEHAGVLQATVLLARSHPAHLPAVIACDWLHHGWLLTRDHGGSALAADAPADDLLAMVATYARLQAASATDAQLLACLPQADLAHAVPALLEFLRADRTEPEADDRVGAAWFIGPAEAASYRETYERAAPLLERQLVPMQGLPDTIHHGDLQPSHAATTADGQIVLFNWTRASRGPAGLSLHRLFGGVVNALAALQPHAGAGTGQSLHHRLMARYIDTLSAAGCAGESALRDALPAAIIAGAIVDLLRFEHYATEDAAQREVLRRLLLDELKDLQVVCGRVVEGVGFEPTEGANPRQFSRLLP